MLLEKQCGARGESECVGPVREEQKEASMYRQRLRRKLKTLTALIHSSLHNGIAVTVLWKTYMYVDEAQRVILLVPEMCFHA